MGREKLAFCYLDGIHPDSDIWFSNIRKELAAEEIEDRMLKVGKCINNFDIN
jgi:hypothetical protein